jgi:tetratricopeptide (TPR) repeat protein
VARNLARWQAGRYTMLAPIRAYAVATRPSQRLARARLHTAGVYAAFARAMDDLLKPLSRRKIAEQGEGQTLNNLGQLYEAQGKLDEALRVYQQSLALLRETEDHSTVSTVSQWVEQLQQRLE